MSNHPQIITLLSTGIAFLFVLYIVTRDPLQTVVGTLIGLVLSVLLAIGIEAVRG